MHLTFILRLFMLSFSNFFPVRLAKFTWALSILLTLFLSGCGGSGASPEFMISGIQANQMKYGQVTQFTISGQLLDKDFNVSSQNCKGLALVAGGTAESKTVSCTVSAVGLGSVTLETKLADGTVLKSASFDVPNPQVTMVTNLGNLIVELNPTAAPLSVNNFLQYTNDKFYDNTLIHRIVNSGIFVAQGGWLNPTPAVQPGQRAAIALEVGKGLSNIKGTIAMARNADLNSATSQFFFNLADNVDLDKANGGYAVFGKVVSGSLVLNAMAAVSTSTRFGLNDFPNQNVVLQSVSQTQ